MFTRRMGAQDGFSLIEISVVIAIVGTIALVALPDLASTDPYKVELAAEEFAGAIRFARSEAMRSGTPHGFHQQSTQKTIRVFRAETAARPWTLHYDVLHPLAKNLYRIDLNSHPFAFADNVTHSGIFRSACNQPDTIYFDQQGRPWCTDSDLVLLDRLDITFSLGPHRRLLRLDGISGRVTIQ